MTLTAIVGALLAVIARPLQRDEREIEVERLRRSHKQLVDHIERLERQLLLEQDLVAHWREEARRIATMTREGREAAEAHRYAALQAQQQQAYNMQANAQQNALAQYAQQSYQGFCNCVPSRAQVWGSQNGLVQELNRGEA